MNGREGANVDDSAARQAERAKKIYRYVTDTARRIDEAMPACKTTGDLFTTYMEGLRQKIRDNCEKLMFVDPLAYGRKALELLWRKAYYDAVSTAKKLRVREDGDDNYIFTHIVCGIGHYHHLISRIITEMDVNIIGLDYPQLTYDDGGTDVKKPDDDVRQWGAGVVHTCLIYLGDLTRYQCEMYDDVDASVAARYYLQAAHLDLSSGMPYNQLGNLYTDRNHNLNSVCYYIHCLSCAVPFDGADGNLLRLFEKNAQYVESVDLEEVEQLEKNERIKLTIARVLMLADNWFTAKGNVDIAQLCNLTAHDFKVCLSYDEAERQKSYKEYVEAKETEIVYPSSLNPDIVYNIVQICLFCIHKVNETDISKAFAVKAFTLALFCQLLQKFVEQMHRYGFQNPSRKRPPRKRNGSPPEAEIEEEKPDNVTDISVEKVEESKVNGYISGSQEKISDSEEKVNGIIKSNGKKSVKRLRRRRVNSVSSEDSDNESRSESEAGVLSDDDDDSSQSDGSYSDDTNDDQSDDESKERIEKTANDKLKETNTPKPTDATAQSGGLDEAGIQNFLRGDNILPSLKLLQDWALTETDLILSCGESGDALFQSVVDLLNIMHLNFISKSSKFKIPTCKVLDFATSLSAKLELEFKGIPLPEDLNLRGTDVCKFDKDAAEWDILKKYSPTVYEENIIRILNFVRFGHQIAKIVPRIRYNRSMQVFFLKNNVKVAAKIVRKEVKKKPQRSPPKPRHGDTSLMRSLGRLWLQSQVRELESAVRGGGRRSPPAYLVVDADALTLHTRLVKQLVRARRFVVLVPTVVLQSMDELKKDVGGARDAIRWLEAQLHSGSRFVRTQRPGETRPLPLVRVPRKAPKHVQQFVQIVEFCHHFVASDSGMGIGESESGKPSGREAILVLLTGTKLSADEQKDFSYTGLAQSAGVAVDSVVHFTTKWRHLIGKPGSKR